MHELLRNYNKAGIPVFLATIESNLLDQKPFVSYPIVDSTVIYELEKESKTLLALGDTLRAISMLQQMVNIDTSYANAWYALGQLHYHLKDYKVAKQCLIRAKEHDFLRFRAPQAINGQINILSKHFDNVNIVNIPEAFDRISTGAVPGKLLFHEHVHPTLLGYYTVCSAFHDAIVQSRIISGEAQNIEEDKFVQMLNV
ncbi:MAG: tetratricopeptide repeat protein, partial [Bacteroidales bacterium]|nr:tetratricopeptide repeat protein [Bacteroidales bacterium]